MISLSLLSIIQNLLFSLFTLALSNERAGIFYLENNLDESPSSFFIKALALYGQWKAEAKVRHIQSTYSDYVSSDVELSNVDNTLSSKIIEVKNGDGRDGSKMSGAFRTLAL